MVAAAAAAVAVAVKVDGKCGLTRCYLARSLIGSRRLKAKTDKAL